MSMTFYALLAGDTSHITQARLIADFSARFFGRDTVAMATVDDDFFQGIMLCLTWDQQWNVEVIKQDEAWTRAIVSVIRQRWNDKTPDLDAVTGVIRVNFDRYDDYLYEPQFVEILSYFIDDLKLSVWNPNEDGFVP